MGSYVLDGETMTDSAASAKCERDHNLDPKNWNSDSLLYIMTCPYCLLYFDRNPESQEAIPDSIQRGILKASLRKIEIQGQGDGSLQKHFQEWTDVDGALFELAVVLGIVPAGHESWLKNKGLFSTNNKLCNALYMILMQLVIADLLERRMEPDEQYRWPVPGKG